MKRFYKQAAAGMHPDGYGVFLDGRPIRTPAKRHMILPSEALAAAIADEWMAQEEKVDPATMPMMRLAATAIDRVGPQRDHVIGEIAAYGGSDLLCYRAEYPDALIMRQAADWDPLLSWCEECFGARLAVTSGIVHIPQDDAALAALRDAVAACDDFTLSALHTLVGASGSLILGLAVLHGRMEAGAAFAASQIDEDFQREQWGEDKEALERRARLQASMEDAARFLILLRNDRPAA